MVVDWRKELRSYLRLYFWYMKAGLVALPFGVIYAMAVIHLGHESLPILLGFLAVSFIAVSRVLGAPPRD